MLKELSLACGALAGAWAGAAEAGAFAGVGAGISTFEYADVGNGTATRLFAGYELDGRPLYFEFALLDSGDADIEGFDTTLNVSGLQAGIGARLAMDPDARFALFAEAGVYDTDTEIEGAGSRGNTGLYLGVGGDWMLAPDFGLRLDLESLLGVEDFADDNNVVLVTVGGVLKFGGGEP